MASIELEMCPQFWTPDRACRGVSMPTRQPSTPGTDAALRIDVSGKDVNHKSRKYHRVYVR